MLRYFIIGASIHLLVLSLLFIFPTSRYNLQIPEGEYVGNLRTCADDMSYVLPARNFLAYGVIGKQKVPDHFRTVGYPLFLAFMMKCFGNYWLQMTLILQAIAFGLLYPITIQLYRKLFTDSKIHNDLIFIILLISGIYLTRIPYILTDLPFTLFFTCGILYGFKFYTESKRGNSIWIYLFSITISALIRPTISLFFILNILIYLVSVEISKSNLNFRSASKPLLISILFLFSCNYSSLRNYLNYNYLSPSTVVQVNKLEYISGHVLKHEGKQHVLAPLISQAYKIQNLNERGKFIDNLTISTIKNYPLSFLKISIWKNGINVLLDNHYIHTLTSFWGYSWKNYGSKNCFSLTQSKFLFFLNYFLMFIYLLYTILFSLFIVFLFQKDRKYLASFLLVLFVLFVVPGILTGLGGSRFRLTYDVWMLICVIYACEKFQDIPLIKNILTSMAPKRILN